MEPPKVQEKKKPGHTIEQLFVLYAKFHNIRPDADGKTISLRQIDKWFRQAKLFDKTKLTTTDTGVHFFKFKKKALTPADFYKFLEDLCESKEMDLEEVKDKLVVCGVPGKAAMATD